MDKYPPPSYAEEQPGIYPPGSYPPPPPGIHPPPPEGHPYPYPPSQIYTTPPQPQQQPQSRVTITATPIIVGACPNCRVGVLDDTFGCCAICLAICFFPVGLVCCFMMKEKKCTNCGATF